MHDDTYALLAKVATQLDAHTNTLTRIEKCLDGNGQVGLVRSHIAHEERLRTVERSLLAATAARRWLIALLVATAASTTGTILTLLRGG
jgi:hypothetical protein